VRVLSTFAPAKVNLTLKVGPPQPDGFHPLASVTTFADVGDRLTLTPADQFELVVTGRFAAASGPVEHNSVYRAARAFAQVLHGGRIPRVRLHLEKNLPVGAGLGGGSADAAATLRLLRHALVPQVDLNELLGVAAEIGSDVPACLQSRPVFMTGTGTVLEPIGLPLLYAVLLCPNQHVSTPAVYQRYDDIGVFTAPLPAKAPLWLSPEEAVEGIKALGNDLTAAAISLCREVGGGLEMLSEANPWYTAMSGSGASVFALTKTQREARILAGRLLPYYPTWWASSARLDHVDVAVHTA
jgi:4-diphosphocytidyl-2-C-methyl-D-erythritol kinase